MTLSYYIYLFYTYMFGSHASLLLAPDAFLFNLSARFKYQSIMRSNTLHVTMQRQEHLLRTHTYHQEDVLISGQEASFMYDLMLQSLLCNTEVESLLLNYFYSSVLSRLELLNLSLTAFLSSAGSHRFSVCERASKYHMQSRTRLRSVRDPETFLKRCSTTYHRIFNRKEVLKTYSHVS